MRDKVEKDLKKYVASLNCPKEGLVVEECLAKKQLEILMHRALVAMDGLKRRRHPNEIK